MVLYVIRHGKAERDSPSGSDRDRPLSSRGLRQAEYLGEALTTCDRTPRRIISSPFVRARDTAIAIAAALDLGVTYDARLEVDESLAPVLDLIGEHVGPLAIVGHNPQLERLLAFLLGGALPIRARTGEAFALEFVAPGLGAGELLESWRLE